MNLYQDRIKQVKNLIKEKGFDAIIVNNPKNRYYLSGFELNDTGVAESAGWLLITADTEDYLYTNSIYADSAKKHWASPNIIVYKKFTDIVKHIASLDLDKIGIDDRYMLVAEFNLLSVTLPVEPCYGIIEAIRAIKSDGEVGLIKQACDLGHKMFYEIEQYFKEGITEKELAWEVEKIFKNNGAEGLSFDTVVAFGENAALPR